MQKSHGTKSKNKVHLSLQTSKSLMAESLLRYEDLFPKNDIKHNSSSPF